jgi:hypothetical protein
VFSSLVTAKNSQKLIVFNDQLQQPGQKQPVSTRCGGGGDTFVSSFSFQIAVVLSGICICFLLSLKTKTSPLSPPAILSSPTLLKINPKRENLWMAIDEKLSLPTAIIATEQKNRQ